MFSLAREKEKAKSSEREKEKEKEEKEKERQAFTLASTNVTDGSLVVDEMFTRVKSFLWPFRGSNCYSKKVHWAHSHSLTIAVSETPTL